MANLKQIKVGNTTYNIEPYTNYLPLSDLGYKTFKVTRGASQSTNTSGYWAAMVNSSQAGSPTLPSTNKWWHVISMDWSGTDMSNWVSQLALPTQQGGVPHYRRNNADGTSIESSTWHAFITDEHIAVSSSDIPENSANLSATTSAHKMTFYRNGISIPYQMDNANDGGILRCRGTSESNTIFELGTWDDSGAGETIQFNYYPTTSQVTPTYSVTVPKKSGTIALTSDIPSNYVTTDTEQTISGKKTFTNNVTVNSYIAANAVNTSSLSYLNNATGLTITGPWSNDDTQAILKFVGGKIQGYSHYDDGYDGSDFALDFEFPYGASLTASSSFMGIKGTSYVKLYDNHSFLQSTSDGWMISGTDEYGNVYPETNNMGHIGLAAKHFYKGYINQAYVYGITPINAQATSAGSNIGYIGSKSNYFASGAFKTVYRTSASSLSDIRSKQNINNNDLNALDIINNLNIINFQYDDDIKTEARNKKQRLNAIKTMKELPKTKENKELRKELQKIIATPNNEDMITIGVSAQQLQELLPKKYQKTFIQKESTNQYADQLFIRENRLVYLSFKAIQEQQSIINSLEEKINLLEEKINALEEKMKKEVN